MIHRTGGRGGDFIPYEYLDYLSEDPQLREHIEENEKIIEKYHRKMNEILQLMKENGDQEKEIQWSPLTMDYRRMEEGEKAASDTKKRKFLEDQQHTEQTTSSEDRGVYL